MADVILMPRLSDSMTYGIIAKSHVKLGDYVKRGDLLAEIDTDKATMELESYKEGVVLFLAKENEQLIVNSLIAIIGFEGEDISRLIANDLRQPHSSFQSKELIEEAPASSGIEMTDLFYINENVDGVIGIENDSFEVAMLLQNLSLESGMMVGLFGKWGRGKTFLWRRIWHYFNNQEDNPFHKVEFQAWQYQDTPATWAYLYERFSTAYVCSKKKWKISGRIEKFYKTVKLNFKRKGVSPLIKLILIFLFFIGMGVTLSYLTKISPQRISEIITFIGIPVTILTGLFTSLKAIKKEYSSKAKDVFNDYVNKHSFKDALGLQAEIQREITVLLKLWINKKHIGKKRVLLFVDDLDRCHEKKILQIIDALRVMLDDIEVAKRVVVVVAVDERILKLAISNKYSELIGSNVSIPTSEKADITDKLVREYMDKLFIAGVKLKNLNLEEKIEILGAFTKGKIKYNEVVKNGSQVESNLEFLKKIEPKLRESKIKLLNAQKDKFEIEAFELKMLQQALYMEPELTPRGIRIFYYRYLLAKRFLKYRLEQDPIMFEYWHKQTAKQILPQLILLYSTRRNIALIYKDYIDIISGNGTEEIEVYGKKYSVDKLLFIEVLTIIDTVVAY